MLLAEAILFVFMAKFLLVVFPLKKVLRFSVTTKKRLVKSKDSVLPDIRWALRNAGRLALWKNKCLVQSIAGRWMLQRRGINARILFVIKHDDNKHVKAHACLKSDDFWVTDTIEGFETLKYTSL